MQKHCYGPSEGRNNEQRRLGSCLLNDCSATSRLTIVIFSSLGAVQTTELELKVEESVGKPTVSSKSHPAAHQRLRVTVETKSGGVGRLSEDSGLLCFYNVQTH